MTRSVARSDDFPATIAAALSGLAVGRLRAEALVSSALARATDPAGEGTRVFTQRFERDALLAAAECDARRDAGQVARALDGLPISVKDLFDVAGTVTWAGSRVLTDRRPAQSDAPVVARLRRAGAALVGKTTMTEFAYSGLGLNPHYGTPRNPHARERALIPGGSSSGAAVSISDGMAIAAIGTDTGGSVRIPAALCGLVGFKPTAARIPQGGLIPLSPSLDSVGVIAATVDCCARVDAVLTDDTTPLPAAPEVRGLRIAVARRLVWEECDAIVANCVEAALSRLAAAGAILIDADWPLFDEIPALNAQGGFPALDAWRWHRELIERRGADYDPRVRSRIERGRELDEPYRLSLQAARVRLIRELAGASATVDLWCMPTVPRVAPAIAALAADADYYDANRLMLRNPTLVNFLDGCAVSLPCQSPGVLPVGLSLVGQGGDDRQLLAIAGRIASLVAGR